MSHESAKSESGKRRFRAVEIDLDFCDLEYATAPCQAILGFTGRRKCFNTFQTCQDTENYTPSPKTYRFSEPVDGVPRVNDGYPFLESFEIAPAEIDPGRSLGIRASITAVLRDAPHHDRGVDKYARERVTGAAQTDGVGYDPMLRGTFFGKLRSRNPHYIGRAMRLLIGYLPFDRKAAPENQPAVTVAHFEDNLIAHAYIIESISGPDSDGIVTIIGKDVLKLADDDRAKVPSLNTGRLLAGITAVAAAATLTPAGIGNSEYPASGTLVIGSEAITFTRVADALTLTGRGTDGTTAESHSADSAVQIAERFTAQRVDAIIEDLLLSAGVDAGLLPTVDWDAEADEWLNNMVFSALITEPTGVSTLLSELCQQAGLYLWWDDVNQEIRLRALHPEFESVRTLTDSANVISGSMVLIDEPDERLSRFAVYFDRIDPAAPLDDPTNYRQSTLSVDADSESANAFGGIRERTVFSRWLGNGNRGEAVELATRMLARYVEIPRRMTLSLESKDDNIFLGDVFQLEHFSVQDETGAAEPFEFQVVRLSENQDGTITLTGTSSIFTGQFGLIAPDDQVDYTSASAAQKGRYIFITDEAGRMSDGEFGNTISV